MSEENTVTIPVPDTKFLVFGEKVTKNLWNVYVINQQSTYKELIRKNFTTKEFAIFSSVILKTPFPYKGDK